ncbi:MAG: hypothetical protein CMD33_03945 [Flavobacteriales bacterium]|nr:hypothetical protein [Flavobacteriales bacterium]
MVCICYFFDSFSVNQMMFVSTGNPLKTSTFENALLQPIPSEGHLWVPKSLHAVQWPGPTSPLHEFVHAAIQSTAGVSIDFSDALSSVPLRMDTCDDGCHVLDLSLGPTRSFKDVGCQSAALIYEAIGIRGRTVVATSGDTGSAAAHAFSARGLPITVLTPHGKVSPYQSNQMIAESGAIVVSVDGDFDACQAHVKRAISDHGFISCNSISLARLLPQIGYFAWMASRCPGMTVVVPSGNFGNATSAFMAQKMGSPIGKVVIASNRNDAGVRYLLGQDDEYTPKPTVQNLSTAMDVGDPSNFVRLCYYLSSRDDVGAISVHDGALVRKAMVRWKCCPHTAVAHAARSLLHIPETACCVVRTAATEKFLPGVSADYVPMATNVPGLLRPFRNVVLVGMPGSGKSTCASLLDSTTDTDKEIEKRCGGVPLCDVISKRTVAEFLELEGAVATDVVLSGTHRVIATGGSVVYSEQFCNTVRRESIVIWLDAPVDVLASRIGSTWNARGIVARDTSITTVAELYRERFPLYSRTSHVRVNTSEWSPSRIYEFVHQFVRNAQCC